MINNLKHIYHRWVGLVEWIGIRQPIFIEVSVLFSLRIEVSVLFSLRWYLDKIGSLVSFLRLTYLIEMSNFVAILALGILGCTFLAWLVFWLSTSHTLSFPGGFLDGWLLDEEVCTLVLFCASFFPLVHFDLLLFPLFFLQLYVAKFMAELELSWDRNLC